MLCRLFFFLKTKKQCFTLHVYMNEQLQAVWELLSGLKCIHNKWKCQNVAAVTTKQHNWRRKYEFIHQQNLYMNFLRYWMGNESEKRFCFCCFNRITHKWKLSINYGTDGCIFFVLFLCNKYTRARELTQCSKYNPYSNKIKRRIAKFLI